MHALLLAAAAFANGQTTHLLITEEAIAHVPDGELRELLDRPELRVMLLNGTMFPDGGYAVDDDYGEMAHWEPFQDRYLAYVRDTFGPPPYDGEAAEHVAFLLGLASHGMADQTFDAMYMARSRVYDASADWSHGSMDTATDVWCAHEQGGREPPEDWVPYDVLVSLYADAGYTVDAELLADAQSLLRIAIWYVAEAGANEATAAEYAAQFPWATAHLFDPAVPGSPPTQAEVVAAYWQVLWARLGGEWRLDDTPLLATFPAHGAVGHPTDATSIEAQVSVVFARGLADDTVTAERFVITDGDGRAYATTPDVYYGRSSHVVNLAPGEDWAAEQDFTVAIDGVGAFDGDTLTTPATFTFSTRAPAADPPPDEAPPTPKACGCASGGPGGAAALLAALLTVGRRGGRGAAGLGSARARR